MSRSPSLLAVSALGALGAVITACGTSPEFVDEVAEPSGAAIERASSGPLIGHWKGRGHQSNGADWDVVVDITHLGLGPCATVRYPSARCSGYWECLSSDGDSLKAVERITRGKERCLDRVAVQAGTHYDGERMWFVARVEDETAVARLRRGGR